MAAAVRKFQPLVCIVDFHHARGPEIEKWFGVEEGHDPAEHNDWSLLPFLALPDGSHSSSEELSYFTLRVSDDNKNPKSSLFGISCTRHLDAKELAVRPPEVTRSSVQKAIVAIVDSPYMFARIREKLSAVTKAWFAQKGFTDVSIIEQFQESLVETCQETIEERDQYVGKLCYPPCTEFFTDQQKGLSLREIVHEYKHQTLVLFKCCLLQPKMLFFGSNCERLCLLQFALVSLIPGLIRNLQDCADTRLNTYEDNLVKPTSLRTSERASLLAYMGLPLQIFGKGSLFGPYTPLQQLDILADAGTKSFVAGSTNSLLLQQKDRYSDVLINLDDQTIGIFSPTMRNTLALTVPDRRWIDFLTQNVNDTWDPEHPTRPTNHGYAGSEEFIRLQFEEYLLALLSATKYRQHVEKHGGDPKALISETTGDPAADFGNAWIEAWASTDNYRMFNKFTDASLFDIVEPRHPCAGGLTVDDIQRRLAQQVADLHLDERLSASREVLGKHLATGQQRVSSALNTLWADIEVLRENQRRRAEDKRAAVGTSTSTSADGDKPAGSAVALKAPDMAQAQATVQAAGAKAGAYLSSWGSWAAEKRRTGWRASSAGGGSGTGSPVAGARSASPAGDRVQVTPETTGEDVFEHDAARESIEGKQAVGKSSMEEVRL